MRIAGSHRDKFILVVEDDPELREALLAALSSSGYTAIADPDAPRALARLRTDGARPSLVLLDLNLPGMSGIELMREVRQDEALDGVPFAVMSAHQRLRLAAEQVEARCAPVAILSKPVALDALLEVVSKFV
jgi:CheY-like chemotaxis protein